jgi:SHS family lactate transporter-like MFS transporter
LVINLLIVSVLSLASGFVQNFQQFLAVRSLFGIGMGGIWGLASATALENIPVELRGIASGIIQQGYAIGYLIAAVIDLFLIPHTTWRALFWTASAVSAFAAALRSLLPESEFFLRARRERQKELDNDKPPQSKTRIFIHEVGQMLKNHWPRCIYIGMLMSGFGFLSHGSQDLYPTYLQETKRLTRSNATVATIIGSCGAVTYVFLVDSETALPII